MFRTEVWSQYPVSNIQSQGRVNLCVRFGPPGMRQTNSGPGGLKRMADARADGDLTISGRRHQGRQRRYGSPMRESPRPAADSSVSLPGSPATCPAGHPVAARTRTGLSGFLVRTRRRAAALHPIPPKSPPGRPQQHKQYRRPKSIMLYVGRHPIRTVAPP